MGASRQLNKGSRRNQNPHQLSHLSRTSRLPAGRTGRKAPAYHRRQEIRSGGTARRLLPKKLDALDWLKLKRASWGIESGLHQRLDVSHLDDLNRVRKPTSMLFMGMFRRLSNSLCLHWISKQPRPHHKTTTDFFSAMNATPHSYAIRSLFASRPAFSTAS